MARKTCHMVTCNGDIAIHINCKVFHPNSGRTTRQIWKLCDKCAAGFLGAEGQGYYAEYKRQGKIWKKAPVIDYDRNIELVI